MRLFGLVVVMSALAAGQSAANDSSAELGAGGLQLVRSDIVEMAREDLYLSADRVTVDYIFVNRSDKDVDTLVAFPMPEIGGDPYEPSAVPRDDTLNFLDFAASVGGQPVAAALEQKAFAFGVDVTDTLNAAGVPLMPMGTATYKALEGLSEARQADWVARGLIFVEEYDVGQGMEKHPAPLWTLKSTFWWRMIFPAGQEVRVHHEYTPASGGTAGLAFLTHDGKRSEWFDQYAATYCIDDGFEAAVKKRQLAQENGLFETRLDYILTTARNWSGPIGTFHLTVDKGRPDNLVSFCGAGVTKTGPTTFELTYENFVPERDLEILFVEAGGL